MGANLENIFTKHSDDQSIKDVKKIKKNRRT